MLFQLFVILFSEASCLEPVSGEYIHEKKKKTTRYSLILHMITSASLYHSTIFQIFTNTALFFFKLVL